MMNKKWLSVSLAVIFLLGIGAVFAYSNGITGWHGKKDYGYKMGGEGCPMHQSTGDYKSCPMMTEQQKEEFFQNMKELKESGASLEEIKEYMMQMMEDQGIDTTSCKKWGSGWKEGFKGKYVVYH